MKFNWKNAIWFLLALFSGGCAGQNRALQTGVAPNGAPLSLAGEGGAALRGVAASFLAARSFDRAQSALRRDDSAQLERAAGEMRRVASADPALVRGVIRGWADQANLLSAQALQVEGEASHHFEESSNAQYRAALAATPEDAATLLDASTLNALGYFLADRGSTRADYERAAYLTRAAYQKWDVSGKTLDATPQQRALGAQDSYAWALFRLGRFREARAQQVQVWKLARTLDPTILNGDIAFHLGEIYRALGEDKKARVAYQNAANSVLSPATRVLVEGGLKSLDLARV